MDCALLFWGIDATADAYARFKGGVSNDDGDEASDCGVNDDDNDDDNDEEEALAKCGA